MKNSVSTSQATESISLDKGFIHSYLRASIQPGATPGFILLPTLQTRSDIHIQEGKTTENYPHFLL